MTRGNAALRAVASAWLAVAPVLLGPVAPAMAAGPVTWQGSWSVHIPDGPGGTCPDQADVPDLSGTLTFTLDPSRIGSSPIRGTMTGGGSAQRHFLCPGIWEYDTSATVSITAGFSGSWDATTKEHEARITFDLTPVAVTRVTRSNCVRIRGDSDLAPCTAPPFDDPRQFPMLLIGPLDPEGQARGDIFPGDRTAPSIGSWSAGGGPIETSPPFCQGPPAAQAARGAPPSGCGPVTDFSIDHVEIVQVVQTQANTVPLVAGKSTLARVFVRADSGADGVRAVDGQINAFINGRLQPETLSPIAPRAWVSSGGTRRTLLDGSLNFRLPPAWTSSGELVLDALVTPIAPETDPDETNNGRTVTVTFGDRNGLSIGWHVVCTPTIRPTDPDACPAEGSIASTGWAGPVQAMFPVRDRGVQVFRVPGPDWLYPEDISDDVSTDKALVWLRSLYATAAAMSFDSGGTALDQLIGVVSGNGRARWTGATQSEAKTTDPTYRHVLLLGAVASGWAMAHELGHNFGLRHVDDPCAHPAPPHDVLASGSADIGEPGVAFDGTSISVVAPTAKDVMGYCEGTRWISPEHFRALWDSNLHAVGAKVRAAATVAPSPTSAATAVAYLQVRGTVARDGSAGTIDGTMPFTASPAWDGGSTGSAAPYCLAVDGTSPSAETHCFDVAFTSEDGAAPMASAAFSVVIPAGTAARSLTLSAAGRKLVSLNPGPTAPSVTVAPIARAPWSSARDVTFSVFDADGDRVTTLVLYSPNGGATWLPYAPDPSGAFRVDPRQLQVGDGNLFRVVASDGLHSGVADIGPISVPPGVGVASVLPTAAPSPGREPDTGPGSSLPPLTPPGPGSPNGSSDLRLPLVALLLLTAAIGVGVVVVLVRPSMRR